MYSFLPNVFLCNGVIGSCLYDFNTNKLYHFKIDERKFLNKIIGKRASELMLNNEEEKALSFLINNQIIEDSDANNFNDGNIVTKETTIPNILFAWIEVTQKCNLFCVHCYDESSSKCCSEMSIDEFKYVADELADYGIKTIQFIGGEPLIMGDSLKQMINYASNKFSRLEIFTNGTLINDVWIDIFKQYNINVALSVYSYIPSMHDNVTGVPKSFSRTIRGIKKLKENNIKYRTANVYMKDIKIGEKNTDLFTINPNKDIVRMSGRANINLLDYELIKRKLITSKTFTKPINKSLFEKLICGHNCFSHKLYISADLEVFPCVMERRVNHGILKDERLKDILKSKIFDLKKDNISGCKDCEFRYGCFDCRSDSLTDNIYDKPWYCTYEPYTGEWYDEDEFITNLLKIYSGVNDQC